MSDPTLHVAPCVLYATRVPSSLACPGTGVGSLRQVNRQILKEEEEKAKIQKDLSILTDRLSKINESLARKVQARNEYDRTVQETEVCAWGGENPNPNPRPEP